MKRSRTYRCHPGLQFEVQFSGSRSVHGLVTRIGIPGPRKRRYIFCYFFLPPEDAYSLERLRKIAHEKLCWGLTTDEALHSGRWPTSKTLVPFQFADWPMPAFSRPVGGGSEEKNRYMLTTYDDNLVPFGPERYCFLENTEANPDESVFGYLALEEKLSQLVV